MFVAGRTQVEHPAARHWACEEQHLILEIKLRLFHSSALEGAVSSTPKRKTSRSEAPRTTPKRNASRTLAPATTPKRNVSRSEAPATTPKRNASRTEAPATTPKRNASRTEALTTKPKTNSSNPEAPTAQIIKFMTNSLALPSHDGLDVRQGLHHDPFRQRRFSSEWTILYHLPLRSKHYRLHQAPPIRGRVIFFVNPTIPSSANASPSTMEKAPDGSAKSCLAKFQFFPKIYIRTDHSCITTHQNSSWSNVFCTLEAIDQDYSLHRGCLGWNGLLRKRNTSSASRSCRHCMVWLEPFVWPLQVNTNSK